MPLTLDPGLLQGPLDADRAVGQIDAPQFGRHSAAEGVQSGVWLPGAELEQFRALLGPLRVTELGAADITFRPAEDVPVDKEATDLVHHALGLLREDLQRNAVAVAGSLDCPWEDLAEVEVRITSSLECWRCPAKRSPPPSTARPPCPNRPG
ncbi:hypothetical protein ACFOZ0_30325, partial [Streptomyces yaanensis]